jgi:hypothetical protein
MYSRKQKGSRADGYGSFVNGEQKSPDHIGGSTIWYPKKEAKE